jgi:hypothetical protein
VHGVREIHALLIPVQRMANCSFVLDLKIWSVQKLAQRVENG